MRENANGKRYTEASMMIYYLGCMTICHVISRGGLTPSEFAAN